MIRFSIANPLIVNLLLAVVLIAGLLAWQAMPQEMFPTVELDKVRNSTVFEGASPEEVERQVTEPIESELSGMPDIDQILSTSAEGSSSIMVTLHAGSDSDAFVRDARSAIDRLRTLPELAEKPEIIPLKARFPVISVAIHGEIARSELMVVARQVRDRIGELPGVANIGVAGERESELWVEADPERMAALGVPLEQISSALRDNLRDLPGGSLRAPEGEILLRGEATAPQPESVEAIPLRRSESGALLRLGEVARVELRLEEPITLGRFAGRPSINLTINKSADASSIDVAASIRELVKTLGPTLPAGVKLGLFSDLSVYIENRLNTVKSSGAVGLLLVLIALYLFLNFRVAAITALGIPVSFLFAIIALELLGYSINMVSLFAFLIALGLVVDDAIIVTENIHRHIEAGRPPPEAAAIGAREVMWPVIASTTTTIAAFLPMFAIGGTMGAFIAVIPVVVTAALLGSLWEGFAVLPSHAAEWLRPAGEAERKESLWSRTGRAYGHLIRFAVGQRYLVATAVFGALLVAITVATTRIPFYLFGKVDIGQFQINIEAPPTYRLEDTLQLAAKIEQEIDQALNPGELRSLLTNVGVTFIDFNRIEIASNRIQFIVDLEPLAPQDLVERWVTPVVSLDWALLRGEHGERERKTAAIIEQIRQRVAPIAGIDRLSIQRPQGGPAGADIEIGIAGPELVQLEQESRQLLSWLEQLPGVNDLRSDLEPGKLESRYTLNERGRLLGLTQQQLGEAVRNGFLGRKVVYINHRGRRIAVRLIYPAAWRDDSNALATLRIPLSSGGTVALAEVATIEKGRALATIRRRDGERLATITAEVDTAITTTNEVTALVDERFGDLAERLPGYRLIYLGEKRESAESLSDIRKAMLLALATIFFILATLFRSLLDPLVVIIAIPFGAIGVIAGHLLFGEAIQFLSLIGFLALSGIVVNDSLILVDFAKQRRNEGMERIDAVVEAGEVRLRPILLTTATTFLGVSPLIFFATGQAAFLAPMAISLGIGLLFATILILVALPCFYLIADDLRRLLYNRSLSEQ